MDYTCMYLSHIGRITLASNGTELVGLWFENSTHYENVLSQKHMEKEELPVFHEAKHWLDLYFSGKIPDFLPSLSVRGTAFQKEVCRILLEIPYGETRTYGEIARQITEKRGAAKMAAQAVGSAIARNPISIIIPCHRVVGKDGSLTGYSGGLERKKKLLELEGADIHQKEL